MVNNKLRFSFPVMAVLDRIMQSMVWLSTLIQKRYDKRLAFLAFIIILSCTLSNDVSYAAPMPKRHIHDHSSSLRKLKNLRSLRRKKKLRNSSKLSIAEALGCDSGLTRSAFMYMDNICHRCFLLFREIEIYYMCR